MARTVIAGQDLSVGLSSGVTPSGTALDPTNGMKYTASKAGRVIFHIKNTGSAGTATVPAGDNPPAFRSGLGDDTLAIGATTGEKIFLLEAARHMQDDGDYYLDLTANMAGTVFAYELPDDF